LTRASQINKLKAPGAADWPGRGERDEAFALRPAQLGRHHSASLSARASRRLQNLLLAEDRERKRLNPILFDDHDKAESDVARTSTVASYSITSCARTRREAVGDCCRNQ
jgi:hypothetical protein